MRLGLPSNKDDLFEKLRRRNIITDETRDKLRTMRGFRNILAHRYGETDDEIVYDSLGKLDDFKAFRREITSFLIKTKGLCSKTKRAPKEVCQLCHQVLCVNRVEKVGVYVP